MIASQVFASLSVIFLVVVELSSRASEVDLEEVTQRETTLVGWLPNLGRFSVIHLVNTLLLLLAYGTVLPELFPSPDVNTFLLLIATVVLLIVLPFLEISRESTLITENGASSPLKYHVFLTLWIILCWPAFMVITVVSPASNIDNIDIATQILIITGYIYLLIKFLENLDELVSLQSIPVAGDVDDLNSRT